MTQGKFEHFFADFEDLDSGFIPAEDLDEFIVKKRILESRYSEVSGEEFYRYLFPIGSFERAGHCEDARGNGIAVSINEETKKATKTIITDGLEQLSDLLEEPFVVCSPISYFGRSRCAKNALWLHALTLDIDYVGERELTNMLSWIETLDNTPRPTFVVNSGHGVHLYFVFEQPVAMYPNNQKELLRLKKNLVQQFWTPFTSKEPERMEALGIVQGFRMVGSVSKMGVYRLTAYQTGERVTLDYLNSFAWDGQVAVIDQPSLFSLEDAKREWPEWYERRIVRGEVPGRWHIKRDLYDWFLRRAKDKGKVGHRYFCIMCLAIYAAKCDIDEQELRRDAAELQGQFNSLGKDTNEPFTWAEAEKALEAYNESYVKFPRETIERVTAIPMPANKRNGRTQAQHMEVMRAIQSVVNPNWREGNGRPKGSKNKHHPKRDSIFEYAKKHPKATQREIAQALKISPTTVNKWLKSATHDATQEQCRK